MVVVPFVRVTWRSPEHLPVGRAQAGDRHFKFHDERDNLVTAPASAILPRSFASDVICPFSEH
jgi:hypothetical protein